MYVQGSPESKATLLLPQPAGKALLQDTVLLAKVPVAYNVAYSQGPRGQFIATAPAQLPV